ncbi:MAG: creatininase family protein, partial [Longimicrobiales bacterium]|nr:creatininase family protein [Longimicrobiales bacterium]
MHKPATATPLAMAAVLLAMAVLPPAALAQDGEMKDMDTFPRPIAMADNVWIEELTMLEVRDLLQDGWRTALVLTGGIEENGPYLTTGKHNHVLRVMGDAIARELGQTLVAPIVTIEPGNPERASTPGGIRYSQETFQAVLRDYAVSLKAQGFENIFFLGDSGGNQRGQAAVAAELQRAWAGEEPCAASACCAALAIDESDPPGLEGRAGS